MIVTEAKDAAGESGKIQPGHILLKVNGLWTTACTAVETMHYIYECGQETKGKAMEYMFCAPGHLGALYYFCCAILKCIV